MSARVLVIDNYDSFTYNLVDYIASAGAEVRVERNDAVSADEADALGADPPGRLARAGHAGRGRRLGGADRALRGRRLPVLGVCLGHQVIVEMLRRRGRPRRRG